MDDMAYCPKCNNSVDIDRPKKFGYCNQCDHSFCSACRRPYHGLQRACIDSVTDAAAAAAVLRQRAAEIKESESYINAHFKHCPKCGIPCEKIDGCNHMQCKLCMVHFCWLCLMDITDNDEIQQQHWRAKCKLFEYESE
ncbi:E3 ubiquitin-protein ligase RNF14-like [Oppia nitens]|uniref:E3 ubiquitin-protein ligase RNF14-like n=1 Tax=Oppia nitens TaxID=1686743 RepID=UPI0023D98E50|nr:E3 ubiquitin-protein ligase RNF14-like [Oppia nitens]